MKSTEKKLAKSNNWGTLVSKLKKCGYSFMILSTLAGCGPKDLDVKTAAKEYQNAIENVEDAKNNKQDKEEALKKAEEAVEKAKKDLIDAENEAQKAKENLKQESNKL